MIVLGLRKNRCPEVRQVMLQHLNHQLVLTGMTTSMTSCPPNHGLQHMMFLPLYMNLESEKRQRERQEIRQVMLHHLQHKLVLTGMMTWMTSCPPNHGLQHMMFLPLYMNLESERRQRERQEVRQVMLHHLQHKLVLTGMMTWMTSCPPNHGLQHMMFIPLYMNLGSEKRERESQEVRRAILHHLQHHHLSTGMTI